MPMKKQMLLAGLFLLSSLSLSAQISRFGEMNHSDSLALKLYGEEQFDKAGEIWKKELQRRDDAGMNQDSSYIFRLVQLARCQHRCNDSSSIASARKVVELYEKNVGQKDRKYAFYLDNLGTYLGANNEYAEAESVCKKALDIYETFRKNDFDKAIVLIHLAEMAAGNGHASDAVTYEIRALSIYKDLYGEHSKEYTSEAIYLAQYYEKNGETAKADQLRERLKKLVKETNDGEVDLPQMVNFTSPEVCKEHRDDMMRMIDYFFTHKLSDKKINDCANYILDWSKASDEVMVEIGNTTASLMGGKESGLAYLVAYMAGCSEYSLKTGEKGPNYEQFEHAVGRTLDFYQHNRQLTGEISFSEDLIKTFAKSKEKYYKKVREIYDKEQKEVSKFKEKEEKEEAKKNKK